VRVPWFGRIFGTLLALVAASIAAAYLLLRASLPQLDGELGSQPVSAQVTIERDALGVVTIAAADRADAAYALGFAHAQDRFFQMDLSRRMAAGRLAELFGDIALDSDRLHRRHRFEAVADIVLDRQPAEHRAVLDAYTAGVNAGLETLPVRPFEYLLLRAQPQPWVARDSLLVVYAMYLQLNDHEGTLDRQRGHLSAVLPKPMVEFLYSFAPAWEAPIDGNIAAPAPPPSPLEYDLRRLTAGAAAQPLARIQSAARGIGSNSWAVAGSRTASGAALIANDMHLGLGIPNTWYRVHIKFADPSPSDLVGVTLPGVPNLVAGSNGHIAWGFTNSYGDYVDLVLVEPSADGREYRAHDGFRSFRHQAEKLRSASGRVETLNVLGTEWGPLLDFEFGGRRVALAWTAHHAEATNLRWFELERATTVEQALAIAPVIGGPVQNFLVGDRSGRIGWTLLGRLPVRGSAYDPRAPLDGTREDAGWRGWLAPEAYPRVVDPGDGQLWTANNRVVGDAALALIGDGSPDRGARAQQIRDGLRGLTRATPGDMLAIQLDDRAVYLVSTRRRLLATLDDDAVRGHAARAELRGLVERWDARASITSTGYRLVRDFNANLERRTFEMLTAAVRAAYPGIELQVPRQFSHPVERLLDERPAHLLDGRYADWRAFELDVVDATLAELATQCPQGLAACRWGDYNVVSIRHPLSRALPALARWLDMPRVPTAGDHDMPRVHGPGFGASERFAVSPGHEAEGYMHLPAGQSGHPLSPFYRAGHEAWLEGTALPFLPGPRISVLTLQPQ
jgi:penicillin amidase